MRGGPVLRSSRDAKVPDDAVEIPAEFEDDDPDDPGSALPPPSGAFRVLPFVKAPEECPAPGPDQPLFLSFCRFLI
jgi:hypothetical protein